MRFNLAIAVILLVGCSSSTPAANAASNSSEAAVPGSTPSGSQPSEGLSTLPANGGSNDSPPPEAPPEAKAPITQVWLDLYNNCGSAVDYCVDDGNALYTQLSSSTTITHSVRPGAKIRYRKGNNCTDTVFTVSDESEKQKANLCK
jgi:hypothetical protein